MKLRLEDKQKAIKLRVQGKSYREIQNAIPNLSKSTLSGWIKNVNLTAEQEANLQRNLERITFAARAKTAWTKKRNNTRKKEAFYQKVKGEVPLLAKNSLFFPGLFLYWAEGAKTQEQIQFANSDPRIIRLMIRWFQEICDVPKEKMRIHIYIHDVYKNENCEAFWSKVTKVPVSKFGKTTYKPTIHRIKKNPQYKGVCRIDINDVWLFRRIIGWELGATEYFSVE